MIFPRPEVANRTSCGCGSDSWNPVVSPGLGTGLAWAEVLHSIVGDLAYAFASTSYIGISTTRSKIPDDIITQVT